MYACACIRTQKATTQLLSEPIINLQVAKVTDTTTFCISFYQLKRQQQNKKLNFI